ncbi:uncharacterized protein LOC126778539 [Nymphalis io]|uniref:uncharacterized protein LOC126778539 n=1 Tax=Inachis io TaxID=171585 RepID=UPI0021698B62|nr:uncharacterized protein LOC126778539 [Nymphalis io]
MNLLINYFVCILIFVKCHARININIKVASSKGGTAVSFNGTDMKLVSEKEVKIYNITDYNLNKGLRIELGKAPDNIFLKDPTTYGNLYSNYKWKEIHRKLYIKSAKIIDIVNEKVELKSRNYINNTTRKAKIKVNLHEPVETIISSFWDKDGFHDDIYYNIIVDHYKTKLNFTNKWMDNNFKSKKSIFGMSNVGFINIAPGNTVTTKLTAKRTVILLKVKYTSSLIGNLVINYARVYGKYHFYAPNISNIMKAAKLNNEIIITEAIEIKSYTDPVLDVIDNSTGKQMPMIFINKRFHQRKLKKSLSIINKTATIK